MAVAYAFLFPAHPLEIALAFDDAPTVDSVLMTGAERTQNIIAVLKNANVPSERLENHFAQASPKILLWKIFRKLLHKQGSIAAIASSKGIPDAELRHPSENEQYLDQAWRLIHSK